MIRIFFYTKVWINREKRELIRKELKNISIDNVSFFQSLQLHAPLIYNVTRQVSFSSFFPFFFTFTSFTTSVLVEVDNDFESTGHFDHFQINHMNETLITKFIM